MAIGRGLDGEAFERLLAALDADRDAAAAKYERVRLKLTKFFAWRECAEPETLADHSLDRVARLLAEGREIRSADPYSYFYGVAINVLREHWREEEARTEAIAQLPPQVTERNPDEGLLQCLRACLEKLPPESRRLVMRYHEGERRPKIDARVALAKSLGIPLNALRVRVFRLRAGLEACVKKCSEGMAR
jgi:DNA-directed RNA polymerase specialized sigma24 family protein